MQKTVTVCDVTGRQDERMQKLLFLKDGNALQVDIIPEKVTAICQALLNMLDDDNRAKVLKGVIDGGDSD